MSNNTKRFTVTLSERQVNMIEEIASETGIEGVANVLRHCLATHHYDKYESKKYKSSVTKKEKEPNPVEDLTTTELCELVGGSMNIGKCSIFVVSDQDPDVGFQFDWTEGTLRKEAQKFVRNGMSWSGILNQSGKVRGSQYED